MELKKEALRRLKEEVSKGKDNEAKLRILRETFLNHYPDATLFIIRGWDTFDASWDPESEPWYVYRAYFSKGRSLQEMKRLQAEEDNPIADRYYLVQGTLQELTEGKLKGREFSPWDVETILVHLFLELKEIS